MSHPSHALLECHRIRESVEASQSSKLQALLQSIALYIELKEISAAVSTTKLAMRAITQIPQRELKKLQNPNDQLYALWLQVSLLVKSERILAGPDGQLRRTEETTSGGIFKIQDFERFLNLAVLNEISMSDFLTSLILWIEDFHRLRNFYLTLGIFCHGNSPIFGVFRALFVEFDPTEAKAAAKKSENQNLINAVDHVAKQLQSLLS